MQIFDRYAHLVTILMLSLTLLRNCMFLLGSLKCTKNTIRSLYWGAAPHTKKAASEETLGRWAQGSSKVLLRKRSGHCLPDTLWDTPTSTSSSTNGATDSLCLQELHLPHPNPTPASREHRDEASCPKHVSHRLFERAIWKIPGIFFFFLI